MELFLFINFAIFAVFGALGLVLFKAPIHSALSMIVTLMAVAGLYSLLLAKTLFLIQIVVYGGAIMVLSVFVLMFFNTNESGFVKFSPKMAFVSFPVIGIFVILVMEVSALPNDFPLANAQFGEMKSLGEYLFKNYVLSFEAVSLLLTAALIGIVAINKGGKNG